MNRLTCRVVALVVLSLAFLVPPANAQESPKPQVPLKVQLVLSRYRGEKKVASFPYQMYVTTNERSTSLRMGLQIPVASTTFGAPGEGGKMTPVSSYNLKDVSTAIDCNATTAVESGVYKVMLTVEDTSVVPREDLKGEPGQVIAPSFRSFRSSFVILLRDGQTAQYTTATDPITGEVLKIDATLTVLK